MNIAEVARRAKVSTATVSRTINHSDSVMPETAEKVRRVIRLVGYHPNTNARALASGKSNLLGLIISDIANPFFPELVKSFEERGLQHGLEVLVANTSYDPERMVHCVRRLMERKVDGVAIMTSEMDKRLISSMVRRNIPIVFLDTGKVRDLISNIKVNYGAGIREAVDHLYQLGHRRIGFLSGPSNLRSAMTRRSAFLKWLDHYGLLRDERLIETGNHKIDGGDAAMGRLLKISPRPSAIVASNDMTAFGALRAISGAGLRVPDDISVVGFDDIELCQVTQPPLTTIRLSRRELGERAFEALFTVLRGTSKAGREYLVNTHLIVRNSTATCSAP
jgi:DNA-binding LacI/PurR family transcriptional regulator